MAPRLSPFVAAALALHVAALVVAHFAPARHSATGQEIASERATEAWVEAPDLVAPAPEPATLGPLVAAREVDTSPARNLLPRDPRDRRQRTSDGPEQPRATATPSDDGWTMPSITNKPFDIGLDRDAFARGLLPIPKIASAAPPAEPPPPRPASSTGGLREALAEHDMRLGLSRGGPVVSAAHDAVSTSLVPNESAAVIEIRFDRSGLATEAHVVNATGAESEWTEAARAMLKSLAGHPVVLPAQAAGLAVRVHIEVALHLPSGGSSSARPSAGVGSVGLSGDLSDIASHARRVVSARIVNERLL